MCSPFCVLAQDRMGMLAITLDQADHPTITGVPRVPQHNQRVSPPPRGVAIGQIPPAMAIDQLLIGRFEQFAYVYPCLHCFVGSDRDTMLSSQPNRWRAHGLAVVASVQSIAQCCSELHGERPGLLCQPSQAFVPVDDAGCHDGTRRAAVETSPTRAASVAHGRADRQFQSRHNRPENEEAACARHQDVGVLAEPADSTEVRDLAINQRIVVRERDGALPRPTDVPSDVSQGCSQRRVVVDPCVPANAGERAVTGGRLRRFVGESIRTRGDDDGLCPWNGVLRVGGAVWVPVGEAHPSGQTCVFAGVQGGSGTVQHTRWCHADVLDPSVVQHANQVVPRGCDNGNRASHHGGSVCATSASQRAFNWHVCQLAM